ncbi:helix-turn-helix domain-containing protein [Streptomyces sp. NPDC090798]|uniref:helix-turn-helix domain-containing protein n=1 Tax=Streptomyces sp. NPDC090798 TaxID=3365968 RepID=UPI00382B6A00
MTSPSRASLAGRRHTALVVFLAALKDRSRLTFAELALRASGLEDTTTVSASTLKRAVDARNVPQEHVVAAFVRACGASAEEQRDAWGLWQAARAEHRGILAALQAPSVPNIRTPQDLNAALAAAYERAGAPPLRVLQKRATTATTDGTVLLPLTTLWRITRREAQAITWKQCKAFLRALGAAHPYQIRLWHEAFTRARTPGPSAPADGPLTQSARLARLATMHYSTKISTQFKALLNRMTPHEVETVLTIGTAYLTTENLRPTNTPATYDHIAGVGRELFLPPAPDSPARTTDDPGSRECDTVTPAHRATTATLSDGLSAPAGKTFLSPALTLILRVEARRNGTAPDTGIDAVGLNENRTPHPAHSKHPTDTTPPGISAAEPPVRPPSQPRGRRLANAD